MEIRSKTDDHFTVRISNHEIVVLEDLIQHGIEKFNQMHDAGEFANRGKAYLITANKIRNGYRILPQR